MRQFVRNLQTELVGAVRGAEAWLACSSRDHRILFPACRSIGANVRASRPDRRPFPHSTRLATAIVLPVCRAQNLVLPELQTRVHGENGYLPPRLRSGDGRWSGSPARHGIARSPSPSAIDR